MLYGNKQECDCGAECNFCGFMGEIDDPPAMTIDVTIADALNNAPVSCIGCGTTNGSYNLTWLSTVENPGFCPTHTYQAVVGSVTVTATLDEICDITIRTATSNCNCNWRWSVAENKWIRPGTGCLPPTCGSITVNFNP